MHLLLDFAVATTEINRHDLPSVNLRFKYLKIVANTFYCTLMENFYTMPRPWPSKPEKSEFSKNLRF